MRKINISILAISLILFTISLFSSYVLADHEGPEKIVGGKYRVTQTLVPQEDGSQLIKFFFKDAATDRFLENTIFMDVSIREADKADVIFMQSEIRVDRGIGGIIYKFPRNGLYTVSMEFRFVGEPGKVYEPEDWYLWAPGEGEEGAVNYPIGPSEIAGFSLLFIFLGVLAMNLWNRRKRP